MGDPMMCLSVRQPYALAIAALGKDVENRGWETPFRGLLAIHAGAEWYHGFAGFPLPSAQAAYEDLPPGAPLLGRRRIVAVATLAGIHHAGECRNRVTPPGPLCSAWAFPGSFHWALEQVTPLDPVPCHPGELKLWTLPEDAEKAVRAQLEEAPDA